MIRVPMKEGRTLHHDVHGEYGAGMVVLRAAEAGTGIIAGGPMRAVFEALGIGDVVAKSLGSRNPAQHGEGDVRRARPVCQPTLRRQPGRGKKVTDILGKRDAPEAEVTADV